jgi:hypothetical protein
MWLLCYNLQNVFKSILNQGTVDHFNDEISTNILLMGYNPHANVFELFDFAKRQKYLSVKRF